MEDDVSFKLYKYWDKTLSDIVNNAPKDWDIIQLNTSNADELWKMHINENIEEYLEWNEDYYSCLAYIINKNGMKKILSRYDTKNIDNYCFISDRIIYKECNTYTLSKPLFLFELKFESTLQEDRIKLKKFKEENWEIKTNEIVSKHMYNIPPETPIGEYKWWEEENTKLDDFQENSMNELDLTKEQQKELEQLLIPIVEESISVKLDYEENPSNLDSGSRQYVTR